MLLNHSKHHDPQSQLWANQLAAHQRAQQQQQQGQHQAHPGSLLASLCMPQQQQQQQLPPPAAAGMIVGPLADLPDLASMSLAEVQDLQQRQQRALANLAQLQAQTLSSADMHAATQLAAAHLLQLAGLHGPPVGGGAPGPNYLQQFLNNAAAAQLLQPSGLGLQQHHHHQPAFTPSQPPPAAPQLPPGSLRMDSGTSSPASSCIMGRHEGHAGGPGGGGPGRPQDCCGSSWTSSAVSASPPAGRRPNRRKADPVAEVERRAHQDRLYAIDPAQVRSSEDKRTTLMIKNIPNKYTQQMLLDTVDEYCRGSYDFFYLPIDFKNKCNVGYAFVNMTSPAGIIPLLDRFDRKKWASFNSDKVGVLGVKGFLWFGLGGGGPFFCDRLS